MEVNFIGGLGLVVVVTVGRRERRIYDLLLSVARVIKKSDDMPFTGHWVRTAAAGSYGRPYNTCVDVKPCLTLLFPMTIIIVLVVVWVVAAAKQTHYDGEQKEEFVGGLSLQAALHIRNTY